MIEDTISYGQGIALIEDLFVFCDEMQKNQEGLVEAGFSAFMPYQEWINNICVEHGILEKHRLVAIENSKALLHNTNLDLPVAGGETRKLYRSTLSETEFVHQSGMPNDPLDAILNNLEFKRSDEYASAMEDIYEKGNSILESEFSKLDGDDNFHKAVAKYGKLNKSHRLKFINLYASSKLKSMGFERVANSADRNIPIIERPINEKWSIRWSHFNHTNFDLSKQDANVQSYQYPFFDPYILIFNRALSIKETKDNLHKAMWDGKCIMIRFQNFVENIEKGYMFFFDHSLLSICISAHVALLKLIFDDFLSTVERHFVD